MTISKRLIASLAAAVLIIPSSLAASPMTANTALRWQGVNLKLNGWTPVASNNDTYLFYKPPILRPPGVMPQIWIRTELAYLQDSSFPPYRSIVQLEEVDCAHGLYRDREFTSYPGNNVGAHGTAQVMTDIKFSADYPAWSGDEEATTSWSASDALFKKAVLKLACANL